jgi:hypothetical protein
MSSAKELYPELLDEFGDPISKSYSGDNLKINTRPDQKARVAVTDSTDPVSIFAGSLNDTLLGGDNSVVGNDYMSAGAGDDLVRGLAGKDIIDGGDGNDTLAGGTEDDTINGGDGVDKLDGGTGNDSLNGGAGDDSVVGGDGNDTVIGGTGNDTVEGGAGDDLLNISTGDSVTGGAGADRINFDLSAGFDPANPPTITDFVSGEDKIAILGQEDAKLSYDPKTNELLLDGQLLIQLDANVELKEGDLVTTGGANIPFEESEVVPPVLYKVSGTVYNDTNAPDSNRIEAEDARIKDVKVELFAADASGNAVGNAIATKMTGMDGSYEFTGLGDGAYLVKETQPSGFRSVADKDGGNLNEIKVSLAGADSLGNDFLEEVIPERPPNGPAEGEKTKVYEFFKPSGNSIFYTVDENEKAHIAANLKNYEAREGEAFRTLGENEFDPLTGAESEKVYRFFNTESGSHLYTTSVEERDYIEENLKNYSRDGEKSEFYAFETDVAGSIDVHRFYNPIEDLHVFTHSETEIEKMMAEDSGFNDEGVAFYLMPEIMS